MRAAQALSEIAPRQQQPGKTRPLISTPRALRKTAVELLKLLKIWQMLMFCNAENVYLLLSGENFPEIRSEFSYIAKCLKGAQNRFPNGNPLLCFTFRGLNYFRLLTVSNLK